MTNIVTVNKTFLILLLGILAALGPFSIDMYIPAFSEIASDFGTVENRVAFTMTSFFIGIAVSQLFYGPLVDKYGRKKPLLSGLLLYSLTSVACAVSASIEAMIVLRFFQAVGGSVGMVASMAIITDVYEIKDRPRAFSLITLVMGVAPIIAPTVGSAFLEYGSWHYIFYFLTFFSLVVAGLIYFFLPETSVYMHSEKLRAKQILREYLAVFRNRVFYLYTLAGGVANAIIFAYISSASFIFLTYYGVSKTTFSILFAINASGIISGSYLNGLLTRRVNYIKIANRAVVLMLLLAVLFSVVVFFNPDISYQWMVVGIFLIQFSLGYVYPNATAASLVPFTDKSGTASALNGAVRMGLSSLVAAAIALLPAYSAFTMFAVMAVLSVITIVFLQMASGLLKE